MIFVTANAKLMSNVTIRVMNKKSDMSEKYKKEATYYLIAVGIICIVVAIFLGIRIFHDIRREPRPIPREVRIDLIQGWMTIHYISRTYDVPEQILLEEMHLSSANFRRLSLMKIAKQQGKSTNQVIAEVRNIIGNFQQAGIPPRP